MKQTHRAHAAIPVTFIRRAPGRSPDRRRVLAAAPPAPAPALPGPAGGAAGDLRFFLTAYAGGLAFFLAMLL